MLNAQRGNCSPGYHLPWPKCRKPPRALSIYWRADGQPCWQDPSLFADEREAHGYTSADAKRFMLALTRQLGLTADHLQPGYEDAWYYLWRERRLPVNVDPFDARVDDELERIRLRRVFDQGLRHEVGYALPLKRDDASPGLGGARWVTGPWFFRDERMYLMPGDSPMGYRLPLDSLPWVSRGDYPYHIELDPFAPRAPLPTGATLRAQVAPHSAGERASSSALRRATRGARTAPRPKRKARSAAA